MHDYRKKQQHTSALEWTTPQQHILNWQSPNELYSTFHQVRVLATNPLNGTDLWRNVSNGSRILEYGCSAAPYYSCYRNYYNHLNCKWVLADIPNFPFHYARYIYRNDLEVELSVLNHLNKNDPLPSRGEFDVVILTMVLEHLEDPLFISGYLLDKLKRGGLFVFDYIKSDATGLDHPNALRMRKDCLRLILENTEILFGDISHIDRSIGLCIARKIS